MTTKGQNRLRPSMGPSTVYQSSNTRSSPTNNTKGTKKRFGNNQSSTSMSKPTSILKKQRQTRPNDDRFNESVTGWHQPDDLVLVPIKPTYSPIRTPPRLRTLITPPGITEPYRNTYNLRRLNTPLPSLDEWHTPPAGLDTWGLQPIDYRLNQDLNLIRRYPSPLTHFGLGSRAQKQKKSYIVVPRLTSFTTPPLSSDGLGGTFSLPSRRTAPFHVPDSQYAYLEQVHSYPSPKFQREPSTDYVYIRRNEAFANRFIEDFIGKCIEDQFIPDLLLEIIGELDRENKTKGDKSFKPEVDRYYTELNNLISQKELDNTHLFSDEWLRELDYQRPPIPSSNIDSNISLLKPLDFREIPPARISQTRYHNLPPDTQERLLTDLNQELIDHEVRNMVTELTGQTLTSKLHNVSNMNDATNDIYRDIENEVIREILRDTAYDVHHSQRNQVDQVQFNSIEKQSQNKLLDTICMDQLIGKYIKQNGSVVDVDDLSRFLDATILDNIIYHYQDIRDHRSRTLDNYALRKFHLNAFMNMTMDLLLTELSASLIEDMKDLDEQERRVF